MRQGRETQVTGESFEHRSMRAQTGTRAEKKMWFAAIEHFHTEENQCASKISKIT